MKCGNCGKENNDTAKFCAFCGAPLNIGSGNGQLANNMESAKNHKTAAEAGDVLKKKKGRKWPWIFCIVILLAAASVGGITLFLGKHEEKQYEGMIDSGNRYFEELDYEKAKDSYLQAISIDPKQKEPYLRLIDIYIEQEQYDLIVETAENARNEVPSEDQKEFEEIIRTWENIVDYAWIVEPEIEADDINYICGVPYETDDYYMIENDRNAQYMNSYAVITADGLTRLIGLDGEMLDVDGAIWDEVTCSAGGYLFSTNSGMVLNFDGENLGQWTGGAGVAGVNWYYYCEKLYDAETPAESEISPRSLPMAIPLPVTDDVLSDMTYGGMEEWLVQHTTGYMIFNSGEILADTTYEECGPSREGVMAVCINGKWGYVSEEGKEIVPAEYDSSWILTNDNTGDQREYCYAASDGFIVLTKDSQWELRFVDGTTAIPAGIFEEIRPVYDGRCWVKKDGKWGVIKVAESTLQEENNEAETERQNADESEENNTAEIEENEYLTQDELKEIGRSLRIPDDLEVRAEVGEPTYYEAGDLWYITVVFYHGDEMVACANVDVDTLEMINNIYIYSE